MDLQEKHAKEDHRDENVKCNAQLDDERHAFGSGYGGEKAAIPDRHEAQHLENCLLPRDHHPQAQKDNRKADGDDIAGELEVLLNNRQYSCLLSPLTRASSFRKPCCLIH